MGRKILFVTTDQQRYDTLGCNGGTLARTPVVDALAADGHPLRAGASAVGGVHAVALDDAHRPAPEHPRRVDERRAAAGRRAVGRRRAARRRLPHRARSARRTSSRSSTRSAASPRTASPRGTAPPGGTHRGFEHLEFGDPRRRRGRCTTPAGCRRTTPRRSGMFYPVLDGDAARSTRRAAATPARRRCTDNPIPREWYHTDWVADRTIAWLDSLDADDDWFCWMSFPDPHHPWDPPQSEVGRIDWRDVPLPAGYPDDRGRARGDPRRQAAPLAALVRRHARVELRGAARLGAGDADRRPGARGQRPQRRRVRADRRGARPGAGRHRRARVGRRRRRRLHHRPRRAAGRLRPAVQGPVPRRRADAAAAHLAAGAVGRRRRRRSCTARSASSTWRRRSARSPGVDVAGVDAGQAAARRRRRRRRTRLRARAHRVGQRAVRRRRAPAHDHPRRLGVHRVPARATVHDGTEGELYDLPTTRCSGSTAGTTRRWPPRGDLVADLWDHQPEPQHPLRRLEAPV